MKDKSVILVVDDQFQNIELLEAYLVPQGYEIVKASSGEEALEKIVNNQIDLVLLDVMMLKMSGIDVLKKLRADEKTKAIPVVMVTVLKETEDKVKALEAGCDDFISKPVDKVELLARVKSILKISHYRRQLEEKDKFKAVVDKVSDGIAICRPDYLIKDCNAAVLKYLNISDTKDINLVETLFKNYSVSIKKEALVDLTITHKTFDIVRQKSETSEALYLEVNLNMIKNSAGELLSIVFILRDVTAARVEEFQKQDTLTLISHKLRTPLGAISGNISLLQNGSYGALNEEQKKAIGSISKQSSSLISMVEELLGFSIVCSHSLEYEDK
ncbi:MAG: response regulator [Candidatus Omnitrophota bacterium]|nr:response regulator [Candidatus Omnitrophota bacterium]